MNTEFKMNTEKDIKPHNEIGQAHGFWEIYWNSGKLSFKCYCYNDEEVGYEEDYDRTGTLDYKTFWIK